MATDTLARHSEPRSDLERENLYFVDFMKNIGNLHSEKNPIFNDVVVVCGQGERKKHYRVPAIVLAAISPVFKVISSKLER